MTVAFPAADVPTTQLSLLRGLSAPAHVALGSALAPFRDEGVLIVASGMTFHDLEAMRSVMLGDKGAPDVAAHSEAFDAWLTDTLTADVASDERLRRLERWADAPHGTKLLIAFGALLVAIVAQLLTRRGGVFCCVQRGRAILERST